MVDRYVALVEVIDTQDVIKIHQQELETVLPNIGQSVYVVNGAYRGEMATMISLDVKNFRAQIKLDSGLHLGDSVYAPYEDVCKIQQDTVQK